MINYEDRKKDELYVYKYDDHSAAVIKCIRKPRKPYYSLMDNPGLTGEQNDHYEEEIYCFFEIVSVTTKKIYEELKKSLGITWKHLDKFDEFRFQTRKERKTFFDFIFK